LPDESNTDGSRLPDLKQSIETLRWIVETIDGLEIPKHPTSKRLD
jgi:hypothetical protein